MEELRLKKQIGANIAAYRKHNGYTQARLAEMLNYSDKAISKWERGDAVPDVLTLVQMAELFEIKVDALLVDPDALPEVTGRAQQAMEKAVEKTMKRKADKKIILQLSSLLVWFVALFIFVVLSSMNVPKSWVAFFYAIPADAIVMLSLRSAWRDFRWNQSLVSVIVWGSLLSLYVTLLVFVQWNVWRLFLLGIPGQLAVFLWFRMYRKAPKEETDG